MIATTDNQAPGDRREDYAAWRANVDARLNEGAQVMGGLRADLAENTAATKAIQENTGELVALLNSFKGAMRVLELIGKAARPVIFIAAAVTGLVGMVKGLWALWSVLKVGVPPQ